jgi:hypothetical protein
MRFKVLLIFILALATMSFAQGRGRGGQSSGMGQGRGMGPGAGTGQGTMQRDQDRMRDQTKAQDQDRIRQHDRIHEGPLNDEMMKSQSWRMLQQRTGMSSEQLKQMYANSGARNYGQFVSAMMVSRNLNLDSQKVLVGTRTQPLGQVLQNMGVERGKADAEVRQAHEQIRKADRIRSRTEAQVQDQPK